VGKVPNFFFLSSALFDFHSAFPLIQQTSSEEASVRVCDGGPQEADNSQFGQAVTEHAKELAFRSAPYCL
jgi:hypothetical protein